MPEYINKEWEQAYQSLYRSHPHICRWRVRNVYRHCPLFRGL